MDCNSQNGEKRTEIKYTQSDAYKRAQQNYREKNREKNRLRSKAYYEANKEQIAQKAKEKYRAKTFGNIRKKRTTKKKNDFPDKSNPNQRAKFTPPDLTADDLLTRND